IGRGARFGRYEAEFGGGGRQFACIGDTAIDGWCFPGLAGWRFETWRFGGGLRFAIGDDVEQDPREGDEAAGEDTDSNDEGGEPGASLISGWGFRLARHRAHRRRIARMASIPCNRPGSRVLTLGPRRLRRQTERTE